MPPMAAAAALCWDNDCARAGCLAREVGPKGKVGAGPIWDMGHRASAPNEQKPSPIEPKGGKVCEGRRAPGVRNTFVDFFRFFHLARLFWNQTYMKENIRINIHLRLHKLRVKTLRNNSHIILYKFPFRISRTSKNTQL